MDLVLLGLLSAFLTLTLMLCGMKLFRRFGFLDSPENWGLQRGPVPYGMGIVFYVTFVMLTLAFLPWTVQLLAVLFGGLVLTALSFADDHRGLPVWPRFLTQAIVALTIVLAGVTVPAISNPLGGTIVLDVWTSTVFLGGQEWTIAWLAALVAATWLLIMMNAINWLDGYPGMVSGMSTILCAVILALTLQGFHVIDQGYLGRMAVILGTSTLVFWFFDFFGPRVLMGDSGTMFLGLMLGVMAIYSGAKFATALIVLAFPVFDLFWTIGRRLVTGQSPFRADLQHFHHELLASGFSARQVNLLYFGAAFLFGFSTLYLSGFGKLVVLSVLLATMVGARVWLLGRRSRERG